MSHNTWIYYERTSTCLRNAAHQTVHSHSTCRMYMRRMDTNALTLTHVRRAVFRTPCLPHVRPATLPSADYAVENNHAPLVMQCNYSFVLLHPPPHIRMPATTQKTPLHTPHAATSHFLLCTTRGCPRGTRTASYPYTRHCTISYMPQGTRPPRHAPRAHKNPLHYQTSPRPPHTYAATSLFLTRTLTCTPPFKKIHHPFQYRENLWCSTLHDLSPRPAPPR
jgi:hypothetical protein